MLVVRVTCWLLWLVLLSAGLAASAVAVPWQEWEAALKLASSVALAVAAWSVCGSSSTAVWIAIGMTLGMCGDASPFWGRPFSRAVTLAGSMLLFGAGHVAYLRAIALARQHSPVASGKTMGMAVAASLLVGGVSWYWVVASSDANLAGPLLVPSLLYTLFLAAVAGRMIGLAIEQPAYSRAAAGAVLFFISDLLLGLGIFRGWDMRPVDWIWLTYGVGQMLIVYGFK